MARVERVEVQVPDGTTLPVRLFPASGAHRHPVSADLPRPAILILPGLAVPGEFYEYFAKVLAGRGFDVAIGELRGNGDSGKPDSSSAYGYHELVTVDLPAMLSVVRERFPDSTPYLLGHSLGGQLATMYAARARGKVAGLLLVASGTPYFRGYRGLFGPGVLVGTAAVAVAANLAGFWPGDLLGSRGFGRQSKVLIADWARLARTGRFVPVGADVDYDERMSRLTLPVLSVRFTDDEFAPESSAEHLLSKMPKAHITRETVTQPAGHNGWITDPNSTVDLVEKWLRDR
ncbi:alpha/beta hydrolase family protein [Nocardia camponoti]|uniref:Alpha/beta hydrolase n=1 Tax=Nocardia camponoti TaxID=1616106 RepID=A0A917QHT9_9NOCA|nr:alpha/beta fold hydrolase [Nocardia camponoti]GGK51444.1 alpha/beta hydrolase [Nocardia camponoti]